MTQCINCGFSITPPEPLEYTNLNEPTCSMKCVNKINSLEMVKK